MEHSVGDDVESSDPSSCASQSKLIAANHEPCFGRWISWVGVWAGQGGGSTGMSKAGVCCIWRVGDFHFLLRLMQHGPYCKSCGGVVWRALTWCS
jgi:hypothetical protein